MQNSWIVENSEGSKAENPSIRNTERMTEICNMKGEVTIARKNLQALIEELKGSLLFH